ncbi:fructosamine kinase family protein [Aridibaculum aurantiacum]|uniref:fructosamine kinase family protein n=1 Tax=Aridibaculum aurantiacum TaxID=2810307 RepID=UPI001A96BB4E|nr:fructosamine kinase family protein [Aridibaculum aurantiacum]
MNLVQQICSCHQLDYINHTAVGGGDINASFAINTRQARYFLKVNDAARFPLMFVREAEGLAAIKQATSLYVPAVVAVGELQGQQYLLLEHLQSGSAEYDFWQQFAIGLARLHQTTNEQFGFSTANYIGSLPQPNEYRTTWGAFYAEQRILPLTKLLADKGTFGKADITTAENLCNHFDDLFPPEPPALLHGDLWSGNFMCATNAGGKAMPAIYDPAVYYGHREMDLGMTLLFGGFNSSMYEAYHSAFPLEKDWQKRVSLTQLYPLLVHAVLFGGGYINQCKRILQHWT